MADLWCENNSEGNFERGCEIDHVGLPFSQSCYIYAISLTRNNAASCLRIGNLNIQIRYIKFKKSVCGY